MNNLNTAIILDGNSPSSVKDANIPQGLLDLNGKTLLERHVEKIKKTSIKNIIISSFESSKQYDQFIKSNSNQFEGLNIYSIKERLPLGSGGAIKNTMLNTNIEQALILNGNTYVDIDLEDFISFHSKNSFENSICLTSQSHGQHNCYFEIKDNHLDKVVFDSSSEKKYVNSNCYILDIELFNMTHLQAFSMSKDILPNVCNEHFGAYLSDEFLYAVDSEDNYKKSSSDLK